MRTDLTDITMVVDRSGSMAAIREDAEGGINEFIKTQAAAPGDALLTLVQFDTEYEFVYNAKPIKEVLAYGLHPRGATALLDAVGRAIAETGKRLADMPEDQRPGLVAFVVVTDGHENSSKEFHLAKIKEMITHQREKYGWQFTFLGADEKAFDQGMAMGFAPQNVAQYDPQNVAGAYKTSGGAMLRARQAMSAGMSLQAQASAGAFTDEERQKLLRQQDAVRLAQLKQQQQLSSQR